MLILLHLNLKKENNIYIYKKKNFLRVFRKYINKTEQQLIERDQNKQRSDKSRNSMMRKKNLMIELKCI